MFTPKKLFMLSPIHENELFETGIHEKVAQLLEYVKSSAGKKEIHIVEKKIFRQIKQIGLTSLQLFIAKDAECSKSAEKKNKKTYYIFL